MRRSEVWQSLTMGAILASFGAATAGLDSALELWRDGWESISALLGLGVGGKMIQRTVERRAELKYGKPPADKGFGPEGGEP